MKHYKNVLSLNLKEEFDNNLGKASDKTPREHQVLAHKKMSDFFFKENKKRGILVLPTGGGKTYTAVYWLLKNIIANKKKVIWMADQGFLLEQARETFRENILEIDKEKREIVNIRIVSGSDKHSNPNQIEISDDILLITAQTAISNWADADNNPSLKFKKFVEHHGKNDDLFIVYDEAHHTPAFGRRNLLIGGSEGKRGIIGKFPNTCLLGLTATATYTNINQRGWLWEIFSDRIIYETSKKKLEDAKILANAVYVPQKTNFKFVLSDNDIDKMMFKHQEIPSHIIEELAKNEDRNNYIAQYYCENMEQFGKTIIFLDRWYQCRTIENYINKKAGKKIAASVFSYVDTNKDIEYINQRTASINDINLEKFKEKDSDLQVLINIKMLTEGVDIPDVKTVFITRDTNSNILFTQMIGRALRGRKAGGNKDTANIVLFTDNWNRHIHFASNRLSGNTEENEIKERGFRPFELISIDLLDKLELEYENQEYKKSLFDLIPIGWLVVRYNDTLIEEIEDGVLEKAIESFVENVIVLENEKNVFDKFITEFKTKHKNSLFEQEELELEKVEFLIERYLEENNFQPNKGIITKLVQIARHLGQDKNNIAPDYFTFEQKNDVDLRPIVIEIREKKYGRDEAEAYLENKYYNSANPFFKVIFPTYEHFYSAYDYEDKVYRKALKGKAKISEASQEIKTQRLASEEVRKIVFSRDEHKCLCCGKSNSLQADHIIAFKEDEPDNDDPELYQTLCGVCNREKSANAYNYRITKYDNNSVSIKDVKTTDNEDPIYYFARLINCYFKTSAVQKDTVEAMNHGNAVWKMNIKIGTNIDENIQKDRKELLKIAQSHFKVKDIQITVK